MNLKEFVDGLPHELFRQLSLACTDRIHKESAGVFSRQNVVSAAEQFLFNMGNKSVAMNSLKERLGVGIKDAYDLLNGVITLAAKETKKKEW